MDNIKVSILKELSENLKIDVSTRVSYSLLSKNLNIQASDLDKYLQELENERYIDQYIIEGSDNFLLVLKQKGFDAAQDAE